jgi:adenylosuccinate synthase
MVDSKNLVMEGSYNAAPISVDEMWAWLEKYAAIFKDYICDVGQYLADADAAGKKVLFEAQLGALRDIDFGIYPYTTSSNTIGAYAPIGAGIPGLKNATYTLAMARTGDPHSATAQFFSPFFTV